MCTITNKFGKTWIASGAHGTFGIPGEYKHHRPHFLWSMLYTGATFCAKTVTTNANKGNTLLEPDGFSIKELLPSSVYMGWRGWWGQYCLNTFGLSNGGIEAALKAGHWQRRREPFMLSWMPISTEQQVQEACVFVDHVKRARFNAYWALQFNASCPNVGCDIAKLSKSLWEILDILQKLGVPILIKVNALFPIELALKIQTHQACSGFVMGNTIPFGVTLPIGFPQIPWVKLFGTDDPLQSPLALRFSDPKNKAGGLSGRHLLPVVCHWIRLARIAGVSCHINAGGGILKPKHAQYAFKAGADSISLGTVSMFNPLWIPSITLFTELFCKPHRK